MSNRVEFLGQQEVSTRELKPHPNNPNRGSVNDLAESLEEFGQYRAILANKDFTILAGHHVVQAAKNLGIKTLRVDVIDCDEKTAMKIMLADNRLAELGAGADLDILFKDLDELDGDLLGTGFDDEYLRLLEAAISGPEEPEEPEGGGIETHKRISLMVEAPLADQWDAHRQLFPDDTSAFGYLFG